MTPLVAVEREAVRTREGVDLAGRVMAFATASHARACLVLLALCLACFLPGFVSLHPMDRDEPRFAQATKQMLETGDFVDIRFQDEARHKKPVGIYWLQSAAVTAGDALGVPNARTTVALYRVPSLLGGIAAALLTYWAALAFTSRAGAVLAAAATASCVVLLVEARFAKTDAVLTACSVAAMGALARAYLARGVARLSPGLVATFWGAVALGILVKGPLIVMFAGLCALVLSVREGSARWLLALRPGLGLAFTLVLVAPWFLAIAAKSGGAFFHASVGEDMLAKVGTGKEKHWGPPGLYLGLFFATFWPAAAFAAMAAPFAWQNRRDDRVAFLLAWVVPSWLVFEAVSTKLPHYVLPLYPALAILTVIAVLRGAVGPDRPGARAVALLVPLIPVGLTVGLAAALWTLDRTVAWPALPVMIASSLAAIGAWTLFARAETARALTAAIAASALLAIGVFGLAQPAFSSLKVSPRLAEVARRSPCPEPAVATLGYREPSLVFLVGTGLVMADTGRDAAAFLARGGCRLAFVERRFEEAFRTEAERLGLRPALAERVRGFNVNGGRPIDVGAYLATP